MVKENVYPLNQRWLKKCIILIFSLKVACRVQIWKKTFCQNSDKFGYSFIKNDLLKKTITLGLFKIDTLNCTMYILMISTCSSKTYVIRLHNLISINIFFTAKNIVFLYKCKEKAKTNKLKNLLKTDQTSLNHISINIFFTIKMTVFLFKCKETLENK